jgi:hypothetical protein
MVTTTDKILHAIDLAEPPVIGAGVGHLIAGPIGLAAGAALGGVVSLGLGLAKWLEHKQDEEKKEWEQANQASSNVNMRYSFWKKPVEPSETKSPVPTYTSRPVQAR